MFISKSKYLNGLQCHKLLWFYYNAKERMPAFDSEAQAVFDKGHEVDKRAKQLFPNGIEVTWDLGLEKGVLASTKMLVLRRPLFEAGFMYQNTFARADVLNPVDSDGWDLIEVKNRTRVKDVDINDLALQYYCYTGAGVRIVRCLLMHLKREQFGRTVHVPDDAFVSEDISDKVIAASKDVERNVAEMLAVISAPASPGIAVGAQCDQPYRCVMKKVCAEG